MGELFGPALQGDRGGATAGRGIHLARADAGVPWRGHVRVHGYFRRHVPPYPCHRATTADRCHRPAGQPGAHSVAA